MITYLLIGMVITGVIDYLTAQYEIKEAKLTSSEILLFILLWPIVVLIIISELFKNE
jgi:hypothetical protein